MGRVVTKPAEIRFLLREPGGGVSLDMLRRGGRVRNQAMRLVGVDTGRLRSDISVGLFPDSRVRVGNSVRYARIHHQGRKAVRAKKGKALRFKAGGQIIFRKKVRRAKGNPYLRKALPAAAD